MTETETLRYITSIKAGSAAGRPLRVEVKAEQLKLSVDGLVSYCLDDVAHDRKNSSLVETIRRERKGKYGITVANEAVDKTTAVNAHFSEKKVGQVSYMGLELVIAADQTGGYTLLKH
jgi:hypothetical protein